MKIGSGRFTAASTSEVPITQEAHILQQLVRAGRELVEEGPNRLRQSLPVMSEPVEA